jgi:hypothetical protein
MQAVSLEVFPLKWCGFSNTNVGLAKPPQSPIKPYIYIPHFSVYPRIVMPPEEVYKSDICVIDLWAVCDHNHYSCVCNVCYALCWRGGGHNAQYLHIILYTRWQLWKMSKGKFTVFSQKNIHMPSRGGTLCVYQTVKNFCKICCGLGRCNFLGCRLSCGHPCLPSDCRFRER